MTLLWRIILVILCPLVTYQHSLPSLPSYIGAVVEYTPVTKKSEDGRSPGDANADNYLKFIKKAKERLVDIIVFPESSLSLPSSDNKTIARSEAASYIPDPKDNVVPCHQKQDDPKKFASSLAKLSCGALDYQMYVVINHREKVDCQANTDGCPADGFLIYNTHVTFDRKGRVISRYRKYNLFGELGTNRTAWAEPTVFDTDFGVRFGQFICFDILFESPAVNLTRDLGVTDIVYSVHWYSELPYAFNNEVQAAWAYATDTNFLVSGHNNPVTGSGGSGIFIGRQGHAHTVSRDLPANVLVVSEIPKKINGKRTLAIDRSKLYTYEFDRSEISTSPEATAQPSGHYFYRTTDLSNYTSELIVTPEKNDETHYSKRLCNHGLCCDFELRVGFSKSIFEPGSAYYRYRLVAFNDQMSFAGRGSGRTQICGVIACLNETIDSCGRLLEPSEKMALPIKLEVDIKVPINRDERTVFLPVTLQRSGPVSSPLPLNVSEFKFVEDNERVEMGLRKARDDLLTFVVIGRNFGRNGAAGLPIFSVVIVLMVLASLVLAY
ncbi:vanin-like protein 2 [Copidosoma floridanum]|uniref:vanin-like protein 2 n=1 Tax=Copidosoma floridanum TaxID=29053 RepID=UPI0006C98B1D|nr:vanin-like protein 2 [Copidosoma floridanum]XP_014206412.1 vanin-like protein 2 [Copidosoma floridanum]XP_014206419.1 vanin-like protein 2 [Copidosoma floridanum]XP_014206426.1 vanin-like protein 2 [Copidosoma floridanum]